MKKYNQRCPFCNSPRRGNNCVRTEIKNIHHHEYFFNSKRIDFWFLENGTTKQFIVNLNLESDQINIYYYKCKSDNDPTYFIYSKSNLPFSLEDLPQMNQHEVYNILFEIMKLTNVL